MYCLFLPFINYLHIFLEGALEVFCEVVVLELYVIHLYNLWIFVGENFVNCEI